MLGLSLSVAKVGPNLGLQTPDTAFALGTHTPPVVGTHFLPVVVTCQAEPCSGTSCGPPEGPCPPLSPLYPLLLAHWFGGPLCGPLVSRWLLGTPALGGCHLSASARGAGFCLTGVHATVFAQGLPTVRELGERGGCWEGEREESGGLYRWGQGGLPGGDDGAADWKTVEIPQAWTRNEGITGLEGGETPHHLSTTETCPSTRGWPQGHQDLCSDPTQFSAHGVMMKTEVRRQTQPTDVGSDYYFL